MLTLEFLQIYDLTDIWNLLKTAKNPFLKIKLSIVFCHLWSFFFNFLYKTKKSKLEIFASALPWYSKIAS